LEEGFVGGNIPKSALDKKLYREAAIDARHQGELERREAATKAKEEALAIRRAEEEQRLLAEVEILAHQEVQLLTDQLARERRAVIPLADSHNSRRDYPSSAGEFKETENSDNREGIVPSQCDRETEDSPESEVKADGLTESSINLESDGAEFLEPDPIYDSAIEAGSNAEEFIPGEYILHLRNFAAGRALAFVESLRTVPHLKQLAISGGRGGIDVRVKLEKQLPLTGILGELPGAGSVSSCGDTITVSGVPG
jgi:hypothetical protein